MDPSNRPPRAGRRHALLAATLTATLAMGALVGAVPARFAGADGPPSVEEARVRLERAAGVRRDAEARVVALEVDQRRLREEVTSASSEVSALTGQLAQARSEARRAAVEAYVNGGTTESLSVFLHAAAIEDATARTAVLASQARSASEAAAHFQALKDGNDPRVVSLAVQLDTVSRELVDARSDLFQAEALQADAELALQAATRAAADVAAARAEAARAAAARGGARGRRAEPSRQTAPAAGDDTPATMSAPAAPSSSSDAADGWARLRECESGGDYQIVSSSGRYRGAYQFSQGTWDSVAVTHLPDYVGVDPATAPPAVQDAMALALYAERGTRPWPHCGRHLR